jgi:Cytochrome P460
MMVKISGLGFLKLALVGAALFAVYGFSRAQSQEPTEFIAEDKDFADYTKWKEAAKVSSASPELGQAHQAADPEITRVIYVNDKARKENGQFPVGTIVVKQQVKKDGTVTGAVAMVKRGNKFNEKGGDWEWFTITPATQTIAKDANGNARRGATAGCIGCHTQAEKKDYVFAF